MKKLVSIVTALLLAATAFAASAATAATGVQDLKGTWVGTYGGYEGIKKAKSGQQKIVIAAVHAGVARGYWQSRHVGEKWGKKNTLHLMASPLSDRLLVAGTDLTGTYTGVLTNDRQLTLAYTQVSGRFLNLQISLQNK